MFGPGEIIVFIIFAIIVYSVLKKRFAGKGILGGPITDFYTLLQRGTPARGILLKVNSQRNARGTLTQGYYELRSVTIDVEIPGQSPYQVDCMISVPANLCRLILPGATLELRVDTSVQNSVAVFGPGVALSSAGYQ